LNTSSHSIGEQRHELIRFYVRSHRSRRVAREGAHVLRQLVLRVVADRGRHLFYLSSRVPQQRVHSEEPRRGHEESRRVNARELQLAVQRSENRSGRSRQILRIPEARWSPKEQLDGADHCHRQFRELGRQESQHLIAQRLTWQSFEQLEKPPPFVVESVEHHVLDADPAQVEDRPRRWAAQHGVEHYGQRRELAVQLSDDVRPRISIGDRVDDDDIRNALYHFGFQRIPPPDRDERVLGAQDNCQVLLELTGEISDDVHAMPSGMS